MCLQADTSIWVGDLTPEVDDFALYRFFTQRYGSIRCAKVWTAAAESGANTFYLLCFQVVLDESGFSKGYGFVRFGSEAEQQHALGSMTGEMGLGSKPIKVSMANQKNRAENGEGEMFGGGSMGGLTGPAPGGVSPPSATWGGVSAWPAQSSGGASGWPGQASGAQPGKATLMSGELTSVLTIARIYFI